MKKQPSSAAARHLRANLAILRRPSVWGAGLFLLLPLLFLVDYWFDPQPQRLNLSANSPTNSPTADTTADAFAPFVPAAPDSAPRTTGENAQLQDELLRLLLTAPDSSSTPVPGSSSTSPKADSRSNRSTASVISPSTPTTAPSAMSISGSGFSSTPIPAANGATSSNSSGSTSSFSPLQSALDRTAGTNAANQTSTSNQPINPGNEAGSASSPSSVTQLYNPGTVTPGSFSQPSGQTYLPQTSPAPGTTGYTLPPALRTPANTPANRSFYPSSFPNNGWSGNPSLPGTSMQPIPGTPAAPLQALPVVPGYPAPTSIAPQSQVQPTPFSVPRTPPGRQIGNGEINTFSNP